MTTSLVSLISIAVGIIGANCTGYFFKSHSFGLVGNTIAGVFGSILLIKSLGRFGFDPNAIMPQVGTQYGLLLINLIVSFIGGAIAVSFVSRLKKSIAKINAKKTSTN